MTGIAVESAQARLIFSYTIDDNEVQTGVSTGSFSMAIRQIR